jgi:hypothetical protein
METVLPFLRLLLAGVFATAAGKLLDPEGSRFVVRRFGATGGQRGNLATIAPEANHGVQ